MKKRLLPVLYFLVVALLLCAFVGTVQAAEGDDTAVPANGQMEPEEDPSEEYAEGEVPAPLVRPHTLERARTRSAAGGTYTLVTSASQLSAGDEIILVSDDGA